MYSHTKKSRSKYRKSYKSSAGRCRTSPKKKSRKPCKSDEYRNRSTGRCRKKSRKPCKSDQYRNSSTGKCRKKSKKPCKSINQYRNSSTGRCRKKASSTRKTTKTYKNISPTRRLTSTKYIQMKSGLLKTPKKIHALWLNFKENKDGVIPDNLHVFIDRMKHLHQTWDIKIWTSWEEMESELVIRPYMLKYIQNPYCNAANKSDCLRFHILEKYGGVWVDLSTYFIKSLDDLYDKYKTAFTTFYMPPYDALMWSIKPFSDKYEQISVKEKVNNIYPNLYKIVTKSNDFVCESYFIMSPPHHPIIIDVLKQMENTWSLDKVEKIIDTKTHCSYLNLVMNNLISTVYNINNEVLELLNYNIDIYDCGYLWIYFMMTIAVNNFIKKNKLIKYTNELTSKQKIVIDKIPSEISTYICNESTCKDITCIDNLQTPIIHLISSTWARLIKWSDNRDNRLNWETTFLGNLINDSYKNNISSTDFCKKLEEYNITQIKTGAFTRGPTTEMIQKLNEIINS